MTDAFVFTAPDGGSITLPLFSRMPTKLIRQHRKKDKLDGVFCMIEDLFADDPGSLAVIDALPLSDFAEMVKAWESESGIEVGESGASSSS